LSVSCGSTDGTSRRHGCTDVIPKSCYSIASIVGRRSCTAAIGYSVAFTSFAIWLGCGGCSSVTKEGGVLTVALALAVDVDSGGVAVAVAVGAVVFAIGVDAVVAWASHTIVPIVVVVFISKQKIKFALCYFTGFELVLSMG